jgi:hypothetical protein
MDANTEELRQAHDVLSEWYAENLPGVLESMPVEQAMLDLFAELTLAMGPEVADVGQDNPSSSELGLVLRAQRDGDAVLSRPVMVASAWADRCGDTAEGHIPQQEWQSF